MLKILPEKYANDVKRSVVAYLFLLPFVSMYLVFGPYLITKGIWVSMHNWDLSGFVKEFIGFDNYIRMFSDEFFWLSMKNTVMYVLFGATSMTAFGIVMAVFLNKQGRVYSVARTVFFGSGVLSVTVIAIIWNKILNPSAGLVSDIMQGFGLESISFLTDATLAMPTVILLTIWWSSAFPIMLFLSGLQQIPQELYEAADVDNASGFSKFKNITLPLLSRTTIVVLITQSTLFFQIFGQVTLLTKGGPQDTTRSIVQTIYETGWRDWELGYATSMSMSLFIIMAIISAVQFKLQKNN